MVRWTELNTEEENLLKGGKDLSETKPDVVDSRKRCKLKRIHVLK